MVRVIKKHQNKWNMVTRSGQQSDTSSISSYSIVFIFYLLYNPAADWNSGALLLLWSGKYLIKIFREISIRIESSTTDFNQTRGKVMSHKVKNYRGLFWPNQFIILTLTLRLEKSINSCKIQKIDITVMQNWKNLHWLDRTHHHRRLWVHHPCSRFHC